MKKAIFSFSALFALLMPAFALAQNFNYVNGVISQGESWLQDAITVIMVLMTLWFLIGVFRYIANTDPNKAGDLRKNMINGLIGLFVAVGVWGIIHLAGSVTGINTRNPDQQTTITCPPGQQPVGGVCQVL